MKRNSHISQDFLYLLALCSAWKHSIVCLSFITQRGKVSVFLVRWFLYTSMKCSTEECLIGPVFLGFTLKPTVPLSQELILKIWLSISVVNLDIIPKAFAAFKQAGGKITCTSESACHSAVWGPGRRAGSKEVSPWVNSVTSLPDITND